MVIVPVMMETVRPGQFGQADVTVQEHRDAVLGRRDGAEARDRAGHHHPPGQPQRQFPPGGGAAVPGGVPDQRQQVGGRGLPGALVAPDQGDDAGNAQHQVRPGQHLAADVVEARGHQNRPPRNRQRTKKIWTGPLATSQTTSQVLTNWIR